MLDHCMGGGDPSEPAVDPAQIGEGVGDLGGGSGIGVEQFGDGDSLHTKQLTTEGTEGHGGCFTLAACVRVGSFGP